MSFYNDTDIDTDLIDGSNTSNTNTPIDIQLKFLFVF